MAAQEPTLLMSRWYHTKIGENPWGIPEGTSFFARKWGKLGMIVLMDDRAKVFTGQCFTQLFTLQKKGKAWDELDREQGNNVYTDHVARRTIDMQARVQPTVSIRFEVLA